MSQRGCALVFALILPTLLAWFYLVALARNPAASTTPGASRSAERNLPVMIFYGAGKVLQFSWPLIYVGWIERRQVRLGTPRFSGLALGLAFGVVVAGATQVLYQFLAHSTHLLDQAPLKVRAKVDEFGIGTPRTYILFAVFIAAIHSLLEEYYWRWFVFGRLREFLARWPAIVLSSLAFMAHHVIVLAVYFPGQFWSLAVPLALGVAGGGAFWAWLYERTGAIYSSWLSHLVIDAGILAVGYAMVFGE